MRAIHPPRRLATAALLVLLPPLAAAAAPPSPPATPNAFGASLLYLRPSSPLDGGAGLSLRYARALPWGAGTSRGAASRWALRTELAYVKLDRKADGDVQKGDLKITRVSAGLTARVGKGAGPWTLSLGALLDYHAASASGTFSVGPPIAVTNRLDAKSGLGARAALEASWRMKGRWQGVLDLAYAGASLDGTHRFVIDSVESAPTSLKFDLSGPELDVGFLRRF